MDKNAAALLREDTRTVQVQFKAEGQNAQALKLYTYVTSLPVKPGDFAIVETSGVLKVVEVIHVHDEAKIEPNSDMAFKWLKAIVDFSPGEEEQALNRQIEEKIAAAYKVSLRRPFAQSVLSVLPKGEQAALKALLGPKAKTGKR